MRTLIFVVMVVFPSMACAATNCRIIEYPDHYEAVCDGDKLPTAASAPASGPAGAQDQVVAVAQEPGTDAAPEMAQEVPPEQIVRNNLARAYGNSVLHNGQRGRWNVD